MLVAKYWIQSQVTEEKAEFVGELKSGSARKERGRKRRRKDMDETDMELGVLWVLILIYMHHLYILRKKYISLISCLFFLYFIVTFHYVLLVVQSNSRWSRVCKYRTAVLQLLTYLLSKLKGLMG